MRLWTERYSLVWFVAVGATLAVACGGSASETPEPVRPDSWQLKLRHRQQLSSVKDEEQQRALSRPENFEEPATARSTWGNAGAKSRPLPNSSPAPVTPAAAATPAPNGSAHSTTPVEPAAKAAKAPKAPKPARQQTAPAPELAPSPKSQTQKPAN